MSDKIRSHHQARKAILYVRQSSIHQVHHNLHEGKIGVLCLAPEEGLGIDDPELRARVGEERITLFRRLSA